MPTNKRRMSRKSHPEGLTSDQKEHLLTGRNLLTVDYPFKNERHRKELYFRHRAELLQAVGKGKRPASWWQYCAKERRRIVDGNPDFALWDRGLFFGQARVSRVGPYEDGYPVYESQKDYLIRHNLYEGE